MNAAQRAKLTAEAKALEKRRLDLIEDIAEAEARHEKSEARHAEMLARHRGGRLTGTVPYSPELDAARVQAQDDLIALERLDVELETVEHQLRRTRQALTAEATFKEAEAKLASLRETLERQRAATEARRTTLANLRQSHDAAAGELAGLEGAAAAALLDAAERGDTAPATTVDTTHALARLRTLDAAIGQAEGLLADCEAQEAETRREIETAEGEALQARAVAAEFDAWAALETAVPFVAAWMNAQRALHGRSSWRTPDLEELVRQYERERETE